MLLGPPFTILLIEDNPGDARLIREMLAGPEAPGLNIECVSRLSQGLDHLKKGGIDLVLLDLGLPDSQGLDTFCKAYDQAPEIPFVLLTGLDDETLALTAVRQGAQDYLIKGETDPNTLLRAIRYATERKKVQEALRRAHDQLEVRVQERTADLVATNRQLQEEIAKRREIERALQLAHDNLELKVAMRTAELALANRELEEEVAERQAADEALRESEARFRTIFENAGIGISVADLKGRIITCNAAMQKMMGCTAEELVWKTFMEITHPEDMEKNLALFHGLLNGRLDQFQMEKRYLRPNGQVFWARVTVSAVLEASGAPCFIIAMIEDITQRKRVQERLRESEQTLRYLASQLLNAQERERERISRELHDELGQSLLVMKLQAGYLSKNLHQEQADLKGACQELMRQFDRLVGEVRRLARDLSPTMVRDLGLSAALRRLIHNFSRHYGLEAEIELSDGLDKLFFQEAQINIYRIFQETLTNIGKYAQASQLQVTMKQEDGEVSFRIEDNGKGFRVAEVWGRDPAHRGLGLVAMEERARMLGGRLEIESAEGRGTRLTLMIPLRRDPAVNN